MRTRFLQAMLLLIPSLFSFPLFAQTSAKDTVPRVEIADSQTILATPSFDRLTPDEQQKVLDYILSKGVTMDQVMKIAFEALPTEAKKDALVYSDFILLSREEMPVTTVEYYSDLVEFGVLKMGESKIETLRFKNTGSTPYIITDVATSCTCVEVKFDKEPIMPGQEGELRFILNSAGYEPVSVEVNVSIRDNSSPNRRQLKRAIGAFELKKPKRDRL